MNNITVGRKLYGFRVYVDDEHFPVERKCPILFIVLAVFSRILNGEVEFLSMYFALKLGIVLYTGSMEHFFDFSNKS